MQKLCAVLAAAATLTVSGCQASADDARGYGHSVAALYANSSYGLDDDIHGRVVLVDAKGAVETVETEGLFFGSVSYEDSTLYASDSSSESLVTAGSVRRLQRGADHEMEWWTGVVDGRRWTLFNDGTGATDDYHTGVSVTDDDLLAEGDVTGDVVGTTECDGRLVLAIGRWEAPRDHRGTRLVWLSTKSGQVEAVTRSRVALPPGGRVVNLACSDGALVVLAMHRGRTLVSQHPVAYSGPQRWSTVPEAQVRVSGDSVVKGVLRGEVLLWEPGAGVRALDLRSLGTRQVVPFPQGSEQVGLDNGLLLAWEPSVPALRWYDVGTGRVVREITGTEVAEVLSDHGESVDSPPVMLSAEER